MEGAIIGLLLGLLVMLVGLLISANNALSPPHSPLGGWVALFGSAMVFGAVLDLLMWWWA